MPRSSRASGAECEQTLSFSNDAWTFDACAEWLGALCAPGKRLDALRGADERRHHQDAERKQHGLQDVRAGVVETEQDRERPAAGERRAEHLGADQDRRADDGDDAGPDDLAGRGRSGL